MRVLQVVLLTDADVDGAHIRTLLLTFLFRFARELFVQGHVYVGMPPLYKLEVGRKAHYCYDDAQLQQRLKGLAPGSFHIQRFKVRAPETHRRQYSCSRLAAVSKAEVAKASLGRQYALQCFNRNLCWSGCQ